jgi:hypothetical protein
MAVRRYLDLRARYDEAETERAVKQAGKLLDLEKASVATLRRELRKAWLKIGDDAREADESRVRAFYPPCPVEVPWIQPKPKDIETWKERGNVSAADLPILEQWRFKCEAIDELYRDWSITRADRVNEARYYAILRRLAGMEAPKLNDVVEKLRFIDDEMFDNHYPAAKRAVAGLIRDLSKRLPH